MPNPIAAKMTGDHITAMIALDRQTAELTHEDRKDARKYVFWTGIIGVITFVALVGFLVLAGQTELAQELIKLGAVGGGGFGAGYGLAKRRKAGDE